MRMAHESSALRRPEKGKTACHHRGECVSRRTASPALAPRSWVRGDKSGGAKLREVGGGGREEQQRAQKEAGVGVCACAHGRAGGVCVRLRRTRGRSAGRGCGGGAPHLLLLGQDGDVLPVAQCSLLLCVLGSLEGQVLCAALLCKDALHGGSAGAQQGQGRAAAAAAARRLAGARGGVGVQVLLPQLARRSNCHPLDRQWHGAGGPG